MPYSVPTPPPSSLTSSPPLPTHSMGRPGHRRSYSQFSDERGPGTFTSLGALPRRKTPPTSATAKRFHFGRKTNDDEDDTSESSSDDDEARRVTGVPPLKLKVQQNTFGGIPFPQSSPMHSPVIELLSPLSGLPPTLASSPAPISTANPKFLTPPVRPSPSRTSSSPILLSNGKPLKSSLKSSSSTSSIPSQNPNHPHHHHHNNTNTSFHTRARSAPSTPADLLSSSPSPSPASGSPSGSGSQPNSAYGTPLDGSPYGPLSPTSSTVSTPKNVHFPSLPTDLEHVRVFNRSARPASLLLPRTSSSQLGGGEGEGEGTGAEETETETERDTENERERERESFAAALSFGGYGRGGNRSRGAHLQPPRAPRWSTGMVSPPSQVGNSYPFPNKMQLPIVKPKTKEEGRYELDLGTQLIPHPGSRNPYVNVALESLSLATREGKVALEGTLLVRNLAFEKHVFVRFTLDEWATVSEVRASYVESLTYQSTMDKGEKGLGKQVPSWLRRGVTVGDVVASVSASEDLGNDPFDRFAFSINLSDYAHAKTLHTRTTQLVARFSCHPSGQGEGEWWDNASGGNYKVGYRWVTKNEEEEKEKEKVVAAPQSTIQLQRPSPSSASPAPPTLSPITTTFSTSSSATVSNNTTSDASAPNISASPTSATGLVKASVRAPDPTHQSALSAATSARLRRFSLSNYVAPGSMTTSTQSQSQPQPQVQSPPEADSVSTVAFPSVEDKEQKKDEQKPSSSSGLGLGTLGLYWPWGSSSSSPSKEDKQEQEQLPASATVEVLSSSPVNSDANALPFGEHNRDSSNSSIASTASTASTEVPALVRSSTSGNTSSSSSVSNSSESLDSWFEAHRYDHHHGHPIFGSGGSYHPTFGSPGSVSVSLMDMGMSIGEHGHARGYHLEGFEFDHTRHVHDEDEGEDGRREDVKTPTPDGKFVVGPLGEESSSSSGSNSVSGSGVGSSPTEETPAVSLSGKTPTTGAGAGYFDPRVRSGSSSAGSGSETERGGTTPPISNEATGTVPAVAPKPTLNLEGLKHLRLLSDPSRLSPYSLSSPRAASPRLGHVLGSSSPRVSPGTSPRGSPMNGSPRVSFIGPSNLNSNSYPTTATATVAENPERLLSPRPNPAEVNSDSLYQAFVKQWCFAGSSPSSSMGTSVSPELGGGFEVGA